MLIEFAGYLKYALFTAIGIIIFVSIVGMLREFFLDDAKSKKELAIILNKKPSKSCGKRIYWFWLIHISLRYFIIASALVLFIINPPKGN